MILRASRPLRVAAALATVAAVVTFVAYSCRITYRDVTKEQRFASVRDTCYELAKDAFVFRWSDREGIDIEIAGADSSVPVTLVDYKAHRASWNSSQAYVGRWGQHEKSTTILRGVPKGARLTLGRIVEEDHPEAGVFVHPYVDLKAADDLSVTVDGESLFDKYQSDKAGYRIRPNPAKIRRCQ